MTDQFYKRKPSPFKSQRKYLSVVYFLDAAKTRSVKVPYFLAKFLVAFFFLVGFWAVGSVFWIYYLNNQISVMSDELVESNQVIFDYQVRYDRVYEDAYFGGSDRVVSRDGRFSGKANEVVADPQSAAPSREDDRRKILAADAKGVEPSGTSPQISNSPTNSPVKMQVSSTDPQTAAAAPQNALGTQSSTTAKVDESVAAQVFQGGDVAGDQLDMAVKNASVDLTPEGAVLSFLLKNNSEEKVRGKIWAVAEFASKTSSGVKTKYQAAPKRLNVDASGNVANISRSESFAIRNFSNKKFVFPVDEKTPFNHLKAVRIGIKSDLGVSKEVSIPVSH